MSDKDTKDLLVLKTILENLVTIPEDIQINREIDDQGVLISIQVNPKDMGIVIGKNGSMANTIKTFMRAVGKANKTNIRVQFVEPDGTLKYSANKPSDSRTEEEIKKASASLDDDLKDFVIN